MGNFFSGTNTNPVSDNYAKTSDLSTYAKTADLSTYAKTADLSTYAKTANIPDVSSFINKDVNNLTNYYDKPTVDGKINSINTNINTLQSGNYLAYSDTNKNTFNMDADYLSIGNKSKKEVMKLESNSINFKTSNVTFKNDTQSQVLGIQSGSDGTGDSQRDYIRIGRIDPSDNSMNSFIRFDTNKNSTSGNLDPTVRVRSPIYFNNELRIGTPGTDDGNYYTITAGDLKSGTDNCIYLKRKNSTDNTTTQIGKWCQ